MPRCCVLVPCGASCHRCIEIQSASFRAEKQRRKPNEVLIQMRNTAIDQLRRSGASWVLGFALIWHIWWLAAVSLLATVVYAIWHSFDRDRDYHIPAQTVAATEAARTQQLSSVHV